MDKDQQISSESIITAYLKPQIKLEASLNVMH